MTPSSLEVELETDLRYHYLEWDASKADHTVVFVHGFLDSASGWRHAITRELADRFHVVAPDMRGHGDSARIGAGGYYHFLDYVADLRSFVEKVGRKRISLVGHSMGGSIVGYYAGAFPDDMEKVVLMEGMGPPENETPAPDRVVHWIRGWKRARTRSPHVYASVEAAAEKLRARDEKLTGERALDYARWGTREVEGGVTFKHDPLHLTQGPTGYSVDVALQFWKRISCPVLLVDGANSRMRLGPTEHERRTSGFSDMREAVTEGAGHMMQRHQPEELARVLLGFLG